MALELEKELKEVQNQIQNLTRELQMLEQVKNEKLTLLVKAQGASEMLSKILKEDKKEENK